jgi:hypothetical protein
VRQAVRSDRELNDECDEAGDSWAAAHRALLLAEITQLVALQKKVVMFVVLCCSAV